MYLVLLACDTAPGIWRWLTLDPGLHCHLEALQLHHTLIVSWTVLGGRQHNCWGSLSWHSLWLGLSVCSLGGTPIWGRHEDHRGSPGSPERGADSCPAGGLPVPHGPASGWSPGHSPHMGRSSHPSSPLPAGTKGMAVYGAPAAPISFGGQARNGAADRPYLPWVFPMAPSHLLSPEASFLGWASPAPRARGCRTGSQGWTGG